MHNEPTMRRLIIGTGVVIALFAFIAIARAEAPECTADRHLDECGQLCPDSTTSTTVETSETTTTTVPSGGCPDPGPCQPVICQDGQTVIVDRCPTCDVEALTPCNCREEYKYASDVWVEQLGLWCHCAKRSTPSRKFLPESWTQ